LGHAHLFLQAIDFRAEHCKTFWGINRKQGNFPKDRNSTTAKVQFLENTADQHWGYREMCLRLVEE